MPEMDDASLGWSPVAKTRFDDEELIRRLAETRGKPEERRGNWWTFYSSLPKPEQERLADEAERRPAGT